jgi:hypothetical protein
MSDGVTSADPLRARAVVVADKSQRVANFHREAVKALAELVAAAGLSHPAELRPHHFMRHAGPDRVVSFAELYQGMEPGELVAGAGHAKFRDAWAMARVDSFDPVQEPVSRAVVVPAAQ